MTQSTGHLLIEEITLQPGQEWPAAAGAWRFAQVHLGAAYWISTSRGRSVAEGELIVISPQIAGSIRASQINEVGMRAFSFQPELLSGFLTLEERHFFETAAAKNVSDAEFVPSTHSAAQQFSAIARDTREQPGLLQRAELLGLVVSLIGGGLAHHRPADTRALSAHHRFQQLIAKMPDAEFINQTPENLARLCGCSPRHFSRLFQEQFGISARERQTELRLARARQLLVDTDEKVIQVALECGYRNVGLFNSMFKHRYGMTPTEHRRKSGKKGGTVALLGAAILWLSFFGLAKVSANAAGGAATNTPLILGTIASPEDTAKAREALRQKMSELKLGDERMKLFPVARTNAVSSTNAARFVVKGYDLRGNTLIPPNTVDLIFRPYTGPAVTLDDIRHALGDLQLAYRELGYLTVGVALPPQQLTNQIVKVQVTEGRLVAVNVVNNRYFSSNNIMRALPSLRTNILLNSHVLQRELDAANSSRDRQISPVLAPGPEPGTSVLELRVKDRLPLHARIELNNDSSTPNTPDLRANFNASYANLWDLGHQVGIQYGFTPSAAKSSATVYERRNVTNVVALGQFEYNSTPFDDPLIANYSAYYRMPLGRPQAVQHDIDASASRFGYNETTRRFELPSATAQADLSFYASRSTSDTGIQFAEPRTVVDNSLLKIVTQDSGQNLSLNESLGTRLSVPLRNEENNGVRAVASLGLDFKRYRLASFNANNFYETITVTNSSGSQTISTNLTTPQPTRFTAVDYLPLNAGLNLTMPDRWGSTFLNAQLNANVFPVYSGNLDFAHATYSTNARARYITFDYSVVREQRLYEDWGLSLRLNGQVANTALLSGEVFSLAGQGGVRGYRERQEIGDSGWSLQIEPHSPYINIGMVDGTLPMLVRLSAFFDYGQSYLHESAPQTVFTLMGAGAGVNATIGSHLDFRFQIALALHDSSNPTVRAGDVRVGFGIGAQF